MGHAWLNTLSSMLPTQQAISGTAAERSAFVVLVIFFALLKYPESLGQLTKLIKLRIAPQQCVPFRVHCHLLEPNVRLCVKTSRLQLPARASDSGCNCGCSASPLLAPPLRGSQMKFGRDDGWADSLLFGPGVCIYCKFEHINLCVLRKRLFRGLFGPFLAAEFPRSPERRRRRLITVQKATHCTTGRLCNCLLQQWHWGNNRRAASTCDLASTAIPWPPHASRCRSCGNLKAKWASDSLMSRLHKRSLEHDWVCSASTGSSSKTKSMKTRKR